MFFPTLFSLIATAMPFSEPAAKEPPKPVQTTIDAMIAQALKTHPEILAAEAKLAGAKAELEMVKLTLSQKILKAKNRLDAAVASLDFAELELKTYTDLGSAGSGQMLATAREKVSAAKIQLIEAKAEFQSYQPKDIPVESKPVAALNLPSEGERDNWEKLNRKVKLKSAEKLQLSETMKILQSQAELKGLTLRFPVALYLKELSKPPLISWDERELTVGGWLQLIADEFNSTGNLTENIDRPHEWFVREYGLIFESVSKKPLGAPSLTEFLKAGRSWTAK